MTQELNEAHPLPPDEPGPADVPAGDDEVAEDIVEDDDEDDEEDDEDTDAG
jgi:hypothetical protein